MDCVQVKQEQGSKYLEVKQETVVDLGLKDIFNGDNDSDTNDPFDNYSDRSEDKSVCDYDSDNDPFKEDEDYQPNNAEKPFEANKNLIQIKSEETHDQAVRETPSTGATKLDFIKLATNNYSCKHCNFVTTRKKYVTRHIETMHTNTSKRYQCPHCPYQSKFCLKSHIISRHTKESEIYWYRCHQCSHKSKLKSAFSEHLRSHKMAEEMKHIIKCDQCSKMFKTNYSLRRHTDFVHNKHKKELMKCHLCDYKSYSKAHIKQHNGVHARDANLETLSCYKCDFKTKLKYSLINHLKRHSKTFQCEKCPYQAPDMALMRLHSITHQEVKNEKDLKYRCDKCEYKTYRLYSFQVHNLNHLKPEEIQYFYCYHCDFKAKRKDNLKTHIKNHFKKKTEFVCYICDFKTNTKSSHIAHLGKHSREQNKKLKIEADHSDKKENQKCENSSNKKDKAPVTRGKVRKIDDYALDKPKKESTLLKWLCVNKKSEYHNNAQQNKAECVDASTG